MTTMTFMRVERAGGLERLERGDDDDVAPLHVDDARPLRGLVVDPLRNVWNGLSRLEHRVEVADEDDARPAAGMVGDQVPGALERRAVHPRRLEAERVELLAEEIADGAHAGEVVRAAVDVDGLLEQRERVGVARVDRRDDRAFGR